MGEHLQACFSCPDLAIWGRRFTWVVAGLWLISRVLKKSVWMVLLMFSLLWRWRGFSEVLTALSADTLRRPTAFKYSTCRDSRPRSNLPARSARGREVPPAGLGSQNAIPARVPAPRESLPWSEHICSSSKAGLRSASYTHSPAISEKSGSGNLARYGS